MSQSTNVPKLNEDLGILVGLLLTDGSVSKKETSWEIEFTNKSEELHELFKNKMKTIYGITNFQNKKDHRSEEIKRTVIQNKSVGDSLTQIIPTFRTKQFENGIFPKSKIPNFVFQLPKENISKILQVMFSTDGSVSLWVVWNKRKKVWEIKNYVKISSKHPKIRKQVYDLLKIFGFNPTIRTSNDEVVLFKKEDIKKFQNKIGFVDGVKVTKDSRHWQGFTKNQILNLVIKSFGLKKKDLQNFKTKEEIINFLKSKIR